MDRKSIYLFLAGLALLPGCGRVPRYYPQSLLLIKGYNKYRDAKNGFTIKVKRLSERDKKELFGQYGKKLSYSSHRSTEVIYLAFYNLSKHDYSLSTEGIELPRLSHKQVSRLMKNSTIGYIGKTIGLAFGAVVTAFVSTWAWLWVVGEKPNCPAPRFLGLVPLVGGPGAIAGTVYATRHFSDIDPSIEMNRRLQEDLANKMLPETMVIPSGHTQGGLIFVKTSEYKSHFTIVLTDRKDKENRLLFDIDLDNQDCLENLLENKR